MPAFPGFPPEMPTFFRGLKKNNNREWFQARKEVYETKVKAPMADLMNALNGELAQVAPDYVTDPAKGIYRIYRDTRFAKDKTPYKDHVGGLFFHRVLGKPAAALYVGASDKEVEVAGGFYMPGPDEMLAVRTLLAERHEEFLAMTTAKAFTKLVGEMKGDSLSRVPKGFASDHPAADLIRRKQWYWYVTFEPALATSPKLLGEVKKRLLALVAPVNFFNAPLLARNKRERDRSVYF
ncbi:MAG: DUF2461 domain-containing protein [Bryobacteraceae bacterium]